MRKKSLKHRKRSGDKKYPERLNTPVDPLNDQKNQLKEKDERLAQDLKYNAETDSYESDVESQVPPYDHPNPYDSDAPGGRDMDSDWDESNQEIGDTYKKDRNLKTDAGDLGMHIEKSSKQKLSSLDKRLAKTPEDRRSDLDREGYPKNKGK